MTMVAVYCIQGLKGKRNGPLDSLATHNTEGSGSMVGSSAPFPITVRFILCQETSAALCLFRIL